MPRDARARLLARSRPSEAVKGLSLDGELRLLPGKKVKGSGSRGSGGSRQGWKPHGGESGASPFTTARRRNGETPKKTKIKGKARKGRDTKIGIKN